MKDLFDGQKNFFKAISDIQDAAVNVALSKYVKDDIEDALYDVTYEVIYSIMELIDGCGDERVKIDIVDSNTMKHLNQGIQLHDVCVAFIKQNK